MRRIKKIQNIARMLLGGLLGFAGTSHLTFARKDFQAQVPDWVPANKDFTVVASGIAEISLGLALMLLARERKLTGLVAALFLAAVFPGNVSQYTHKRNAFGLDTDKRRFVRLFFQPVLIAWALFGSTLINRKHRKLLSLPFKK